MKKVKFDFRKHIQTYNFDLDKVEFPIKDNYAANLKLDNAQGEKMKSYIRGWEDDGYREVTLKITSLRGSIGAVHFYGKLQICDICFTRIEDKKNEYNCGGYSTKGIPDQYTDFEVDLVRLVDDRDIKNDENWGREKYMRVKKGQTTKGFWIEEDVIEIGKQVFKAMFEGKWKLRIESYGFR